MNPKHLAEMNKKIPYTLSNTKLSRQNNALTGKDLPLFTYLANHLNTQGSVRLIRFFPHLSQCSSLDLHLITDKSDRHVIKVIDFARKDVIREIPHTDLQHIMQASLLIQSLQAKDYKRSGTEVADTICSAQEVL